MELFDVIIIGGGPAGSTAATLLARKGHKILLIEKEKFPREHIGESLIPLSYHTLENLGVLEELKKISPRKPGVNFIDSDGKKQSLWCFKNVVKDKSYLSFHVKRSLFDEMLLTNSRKSGAEVLEETTVKNVLLDRPDGIVEVTATSHLGEQKFMSRFIVDASGQSTFLGSKLGVKKSFKDLDRVALWSHWSNSEFDIPLQQGVIKIVYLGGEKKGWVWVIPISSDNLSIGVVVNNSFVKEEKSKLITSGSSDWKKDLYLKEIEDSPAVNVLLKKAIMNHKVQVNGDYSYYCEKKFGNNFAMIGDAGAFLDPIFSSGIYVGMHSAELISEALHQKLISGKDEAINEAYGQINGAVKLLEKFIRLFYTPEIMNFAMMGHPEKLLSYKKTETIYSIFHYLLAGDFFKNHEKYSEFIDTMKDVKMINKFQHLIDHSKDEAFGATCGENYKEMYGEMTENIKFDHSAFS
ncbi:MAG: dependent oxidoreductase [Bacteroidetes bacterium]|jgi:flavin-dependent dehydrogenase|nr:dependent oxidoreductase [Bacteroidota bacterium]